MKIANKRFLEKVRRLYIKNPCYVSSISFWKIESTINKASTFHVVKNGFSYLYALSDKKLMFYWSSDKNDFLFNESEINDFDLLVIHDDVYQLIKDKLISFNQDDMYPLLYTGDNEPVSINDDFKVENFDFNNTVDFVNAAELINGVYVGHNHTASEVKSWMEAEAFDPSLWIWIKHKLTDKCAALGISTYQASIKETYLDWIQVSNNYQKKGLGKVLVNETIRRSFNKSNIIRVTGIAGDFYKKCGFVSQEKWWFIKKITNEEF